MESTASKALMLGLKSEHPGHAQVGEKVRAVGAHRREHGGFESKVGLEKELHSAVEVGRGIAPAVERNATEDLTTSVQRSLKVWRTVWPTKSSSPLKPVPPASKNV